MGEEGVEHLFRPGHVGKRKGLPFTEVLQHRAYKVVWQCQITGCVLTPADWGTSSQLSQSWGHHAWGWWEEGDHWTEVVIAKYLAVYDNKEFQFSSFASRQCITLISKQNKTHDSHTNIKWNWVPNFQSLNEERTNEMLILIQKWIWGGHFRVFQPNKYWNEFPKRYKQAEALRDIRQLILPSGISFSTLWKRFALLLDKNHLLYSQFHSFLQCNLYLHRTVNYPEQ